MKRIITTVLLFAMMLSCIVCSAEEQRPTTFEDYVYVVLEDGTAEIVEYSGTDSDLVIPEAIDDIVVSSIGNKAFAANETYRTVTISDTVKVIGDLAFAGCVNLKSVYIPDSVIDVGANPFRYCPNLKEITVSQSNPVLKTVDGVLFDDEDKRIIYCQPEISLFEYSIPDGTRTIGSWAFYGCENLKSVTIPDSVTCIEVGAFMNCVRLNNITIPDSVTEINGNPFIYCSSLDEIVLSSDHPSLATINGVLVNKPDKRLIYYPRGFSFKEYTIPSEIESQVHICV